MIKWASDVIAANIDEACRYIRKAYELRDEHRPAADWCREMAAAHLAFNNNGHALVKKLIDERKASAEKHEYTDGMMAVWADRHAELTAKTAEVRAMIDTYK